MLPPGLSFHQAKIIPAEIPTGKNKKPSHSFSPEGWEPSPTMKAKIKAILARLQSLAVQRRAGTHLWCLAIALTIVHLPAIIRELALTPRPA
jgi:hypothetical protein